VPNFRNKKSIIFQELSLQQENLFCTSHSSMTCVGRSVLQVLVPLFWCVSVLCCVVSSVSVLCCVVSSVSVLCCVVSSVSVLCCVVISVSVLCCVVSSVSVLCCVVSSVSHAPYVQLQVGTNTNQYRHTPKQRNNCNIPLTRNQNTAYKK
jgi:hypothetical protein